MLPDVPTTFGELVKYSFQQYFPVLLKTFLLILLMVLVKDAYLYLGGMPSNTVLNISLEIIITLVVGYFAFAGLYTAHKVISNEKMTFKKSLIEVWQRALKAYFIWIIYLLVLIVLLFIAYLILHLIQSTGKRAVLYRALIFFFIVGLPYLLLLIFSFFSIPLVLIDDVPLTQSFQQSMKLVGKQYWFRTFILYLLFIAIVLIVDPNTRHGHFLAKYHLNAIFDFIFLIIVLPMYYNMLVFTLNDLKLAKRM